MIRRTSINLDFDLVGEAKGALGTTGTTETIHRALDDVVRRHKLRGLLAHRFELDPKERDWLRRPGGDVLAPVGRSRVGAG